MSVINPILINTGSPGNNVDVFKAIDIKFKEPFQKLYSNIGIKLNDVQVLYEPDINNTIVYNDTAVSIVIDSVLYEVGIPTSFSDLIRLLNLLDIGWFYTEDSVNIVGRGFHIYGNIVQEDMVVFTSGSQTTLSNIPTQTDINRELSLRIKVLESFTDYSSTNSWNFDGNAVESKRSIGTTNNYGLPFIVNDEILWEFRTNKSIHREGHLYSIKYDTSNTSWGGGALTDFTTGINDSAFGADALSHLTAGEDNTGVGKNSLHLITVSDNNTAVGYNSGSDLEVGSNNIFIGRNSGNNLINGNALTFLGSNSKTALDGIHSSIAIGYNAEVNASNQLVIGAVPDGSGYGAITQVLTYYTASKVHSEFYRETLPNAGSGTMAGRGSTYYVNDGSTGSGWIKVGATDTGWEMIQTTAALAIPNQELVFGNGSTIVSSPNIKFNTSNNRFTVNGEIYAGNSTGLITDSVMKLSNATGTSFLYTGTTSPESVITSPRSSLALINTGSNGQLWLKQTTAGDTGWGQVLAGVQSSLNVLGLTAITQLVNQIRVTLNGNDYYIPCSAANTPLT